MCKYLLEQLIRHASVGMSYPMRCLVRFCRAMENVKRIDIVTGYARDSSAVAREAVKHAVEEGYDCVLIDTAGRMQV